MEVRFLPGAPPSQTRLLCLTKVSQVWLGHAICIIGIGKLNLPVMHNHVYTLVCNDQRFYTGYTTNLRIQLSEHVRGAVRATKYRRPVKLIHYECFISKRDAKTREIFLKSGFGRNNLKKALQGTLKAN